MRYTFRIAVLAALGTAIFALGALAQNANPNTANSVLASTFNPSTNAINIEVGGALGQYPATLPLPNTADSVLANIFDPSTKAINVNCLSGCGGGGSGLPSSWSIGSNNAVTAAPITATDVVPLTVASGRSSGGTADIFDVCQTSPCSTANKFFWVTWNGNLGFQASNLQLGTTGAAPYLYLNGTNALPGQPHLQLSTASIASPTLGSLAQGSGLSGAGTVYVKITYLNSAGETLVSNEQNITLSANSDLTIPAPGVESSAAAYQIYDGSSSGSESLVPAGTGVCEQSGLAGNHGPACAVTSNATLYGSIGTAPTLGTLTSGSGNIGARIAYAKIAYVGAGGTTPLSSEQSITLGANSSLVVPAPGAQAGAFGYQIWYTDNATGGAGQEQLVIVASSNCTLATQQYLGQSVCAIGANATFTSAPSDYSFGGPYAPPTMNNTGGASFDNLAPAANGPGLFLQGSTPGVDAAVGAGLLLPGGTGINLTSGATTTTGNLACISASNTVSQCGANAANTIIGVFTESGQNSLVQTTGVATVNLAANATTTANDYACSNATAGTVIDNGVTPCASGQQVGLITQTNLSVVASVPVMLRFGSSGGSSTTFQANGTNLTSSSTVNWENGGPITVTNPSTGNVQFNCATCLIQNPTTTAQNTITGQNATSVPFTINGFGNTGGHAIDINQNGYDALYVNAFGDLVGGRDIQSLGDVDVDANQSGAHLIFGSNSDLITFSNNATGNGGIRGQLVITSATSQSFTFPLAYGSAPVCTLTPTSNPGSLTWWVTTTATAVTANLSASGTLTFNYICVGNPN